MTLIETAESKSRARAITLLVLAIATAVIMVFDNSDHGNDFTHGFWIGLTFTSVLWLFPLKRWLFPHSTLQRLMEDEGTQNHRHIACSTGFWASILAALSTTILNETLGGIPTDMAVRIITTVAVATALGSFALLELRAAR